MSRDKKSLAFAALALLALTSTPLALRASAPIAATVARLIPADGGDVAFGSFAGFAGALHLPSSDAPAHATVTMRSSTIAPDDVPSELRDALDGVADRIAAPLWLEATPSDDVTFDPGDVGFSLELRAVSAAADRAYFALACDRANCKPRAIGPLFRDGDTLLASNAHTPFHFHFAARARHDYFAVIYERHCREGLCNR